VSELSNYKTNLVPAFWKYIIALEIFLWIPSVFIGFDPHHDGLILTNVNFLNESLKTNGAWPFNQYGPFWIFPYSFLTYFLSSELTFIAIRIITLGFYFLAAYLIFLSAQIIAGRRNAHISVLVFFFSQPFLTNYATSLVPWPSAIVMPITALIFLLILQIYKEPISKFKFVTKSASIGILISTILFSRVQIGFLMLLAVVIFLGFTQKLKSLFFILLGFTLNCSVFALFFNWRGWLSDALSDQLVFGSVYLRGDTISYPYPVFTMVGIVFFLILILFAPRLLLKLSSKNYFNPLITLIVCLTFLTLFWLIQSREISLMNASVVLLRRFWISYFLAIIVYSFFSQAKKTYTHLRRKREFERDLVVRNCLVIFSIVSMAQIFPLFDQMHFWWGSIPAVILVVLVSQERFFQNNLTSRSTRASLNFLIIFFATLTVIPLSAHLDKSYSRYPVTVAKFILVPEKQSSNEVKVQEFFRENIRSNSTILNLCADSNIFFNQLNNFKSASRIYVYWLSMNEVDKMYESLTSSSPQYIITCARNGIAGLKEKSEAFQNEILEKSFPSAKLTATHLGAPGLTWRIYKE
jgi:hypothetical protein